MQRIQMAKKTAAPRRQKTPAEVTFSLRVTPEQRDILTTAAKELGWSPTQLIKKSALEKSVHILNTRKPRSFDFLNAADEVVSQLLHSTYDYELTGGGKPVKYGTVGDTYDHGQLMEMFYAGEVEIIGPSRGFSQIHLDGPQMHEPCEW